MSNRTNYEPVKRTPAEKNKKSANTKLARVITVMLFLI